MIKTATINTLLHVFLGTSTVTISFGLGSESLFATMYFFPMRSRISTSCLLVLTMSRTLPSWCYLNRFSSNLHCMWLRVEHSVSLVFHKKNPVRHFEELQESHCKWKGTRWRNKCHNKNKFYFKTILKFFIISSKKFKANVWVW